MKDERRSCKQLRSAFKAAFRMHKTWLFSLLSFWKSMTGENLLTIWQGANDKRQTARSEWCKNIKILTRLLMELPLLQRFVEILLFLNLHNHALCPIFYFTTLPDSSRLYQNYVRWTIEWVILGWFFQITLLQAGIYARHTKEQETYRFHMF